MPKLRYQQTKIFTMLSSGNLCKILLLSVTLFTLSPLIPADNILAIFSYAVSSPCLVVRPLVKALVERGHQLTVISAGKYFPSIDGIHHIRVTKLDNLLEEMSEYTFEITPNKWSEAIWLSKYFYYSSNHILSNSEVQQLLVNSSANFDLIIVDTPNSGALCGFAQHFKAPMMGIAAFGSAWIIDYFAGNSAPTIYDPVSPVGYTYAGSSLMDKWRKWVYMTEEWLLDRLVFIPQNTKLYRLYFNNSSSDFEEIRRNFSLILVNQHFSLGRVRSNVPNIIEVAGMHMCFENNCKFDQMPQDLQRFMDEAEHGVIYFSMGVEIMMKWLPDNLKQVLLETFSNLNQRVIWKFEDWEQILRHPKVKLFITHGGVLSLIESAYCGVPVLTLPLYYDQFANAQRMRLAGVGKTIKLVALSMETFNQTIHELLQNTSYTRNAQKMSERFRDQPKNPLDTAVWWTEYVLRHKGSPHMRIAEHDLPFMKYYDLELIPIIFGRIGISAIILIFLSYKLINWIIVHSHFTLISIITG